VCNSFSFGSEKRAEIVYDVFLPDANFRKSNPGQPAVCLCIARLVTEFYSILIYSNTTKNNILFIHISASRRKPSSGLTSGAGRQYVKACPIRGSTGSALLLDSCRRSSWGDMDQEDWQHESRQGKLPVEPCMGQAFTRWRPAPEVSPDEGFRMKPKRR